ncbi:MAG: HIT domain-containing protein [Candidatus Nanopelagicales bacterium]
MSVCVFCRIVSGEIPSSKVFENDDFVAFHDINPVAPIHVIVVPKVHTKDIAEFSNSSNTNYLVAISETAATFDHNGYRVIFNTGKDAGQTEFHVHAHILAGEPLSAMNGKVH